MNLCGDISDELLESLKDLGATRRSFVVGCARPSTDAPTGKEIQWSIAAKVKEGKLDDLKAVGVEMSKTASTDPGMHLYEWYIGGADSDTLVIMERYASSAAVMAHMGLGEPFMERFMACIEPGEIMPCGAPDEAVLEAFKSFGGKKAARVAGFIRAA